MPVQSESNHLGDWLKFEEDNLYSRDEVTVISGENLATGTVIGVITSSGKVTQLAPGASDGSETAAGVLLNSVDARAADKPGVIIARHAICADKGLVWPASITGPQKTAAISQLKALGILVREGA
ncbi:MAG: head decoration protein [Bryobacteraceae bacterium]|nr:head decoration protein [Bryobacteraceae bacterium]